MDLLKLLSPRLSHREVKEMLVKKVLLKQMINASLKQMIKGGSFDYSIFMCKYLTSKAVEKRWERARKYKSV